MSNSRSRKHKPHTNAPSRQSRRMDLHLHTPGSSDYQEIGVCYLDILRQAEFRGLDIVAFTDHNTVAGGGDGPRSIRTAEGIRHRWRRWLAADPAAAPGSRIADAVPPR